MKRFACLLFFLPTLALAQDYYRGQFHPRVWIYANGNDYISNVVGDIIASKKGEGILSATYSASGNMEQPDISMNPLSMLAPGIFRRIFQGHIPSQSDAPSNKQAAQAQAPGPAPRPTQ